MYIFIYESKNITIYFCAYIEIKSQCVSKRKIVHNPLNRGRKCFPSLRLTWILVSRGSSYGATQLGNHTLKYIPGTMIYASDIYNFVSSAGIEINCYKIHPMQTALSFWTHRTICGSRWKNYENIIRSLGKLYIKLLWSIR